jgi:hypothetical protein
MVKTLRPKLYIQLYQQKYVFSHWDNGVASYSALYGITQFLL